MAGRAIVGRYYRAAVAAKEPAFPDAYIYLDATLAELEARRAHDARRSRRSFVKHLRKRDLQRSYFVALQAVAPDRVVFLPTTSRAALAGQVVEVAKGLPEDPPDSAALLDHMIEWVERRVRE